MSMDIENRFSKAVSKSLYGMCPRSEFLMHSAALKELWSHLVALSLVHYCHAMELVEYMFVWQLQDSAPFQSISN